MGVRGQCSIHLSHCSHFYLVLLWFCGLIYVKCWIKRECSQLKFCIPVRLEWMSWLILIFFAYASVASTIICYLTFFQFTCIYKYICIYRQMQRAVDESTRVIGRTLLIPFAWWRLYKIAFQGLTEEWLAAEFSAVGGHRGWIPSQGSLHLGLSLNELSTNAAKSLCWPPVCERVKTVTCLSWVALQRRSKISAKAEVRQNEIYLCEIPLSLWYVLVMKQQRV